jgi:hypothetical protein
MSENLYTLVQTMASKLAKKHRTELKYDDMIQALSDELKEFGVGEMSLGTWSQDFAFGGAMYTTFTSKVLLLPETIINGFGQQEIVDKNHFMMEIFRIPLNKPCTLESLLYIACYTGILSACMKSEDFPEGIVRTFKALNLHAMACYIDTDAFSVVDQQIPKEKQTLIVQSLVNGAKH